MAQGSDPLQAIAPLLADGASSYQYKSTGSISSGGLTIAHRNGHRRTLVDVFFEPATAGIFLDIQVGDRNYVRLPTQLGDYSAYTANQKGVKAVSAEAEKIESRGLLQYIRQLIPFDLPTSAQDEDIIITPVAPLGYGAIPGAYVVSAIYLDQTDGDVTAKNVPGGSFAIKRLAINILTNGLAQPTAGRNLLDTAKMQLGLQSIKDGDITTLGQRFTAYAFAFDGSALGTTTGGNANGKPTRLHMQDTDIEIYTPEDQEGLLVDRDLSNVLAMDFLSTKYFAPNKPYIFDQGRKFTFQLDTAQKAGAGANYGANLVCFLMFGIRELIGAA